MSCCCIYSVCHASLDPKLIAHSVFELNCEQNLENPPSVCIDPTHEAAIFLCTLEHSSTVELWQKILHFKMKVVPK